MNKALNLLEKIAALMAVFFLPSQLALHFWPETAFVFGIRIDYLSPAVYFTDVLVIILVSLLIVRNKDLLINFLGKNKNILFVFLIILIFNTILSTVPSVSLYKWIKISEYLFFGIYIFLRKEFLGLNNIYKTFLSSTVLVSLIGITQFFLRSTTGFFYFLGERSFTTSSPGIALVSLNGENFLRAYSIFSHPNSLAGYLGVALIIFLFSKVLKRKKIWYLSILIILLCFILTFSLSAYIALAILTLIFIFRDTKIFTGKLLISFLFLSVIASLILPIYSERIISSFSLPENILQRMELSYISGKMAGQHFLIGEGLNTFISNSINFKGVNIYSWLLQPVHNIFLLSLTEIGMSGLIFLVAVIGKLIRIAYKENKYLILAAVFIILFTGLSDHYWLTIQQNSLLIALLLGLGL